MQFVRYFFVQVLAYSIDVIGFLVLFEYFEIDPLISNIVGKTLAGFFAFFIHRRFTFYVPYADEKLKQAARYFTLLALNVPFSFFILGALLWVISLAVVAKLIADIICVGITFWVSKRFVFLASNVPQNNFGTNRDKK